MDFTVNAQFKIEINIFEIYGDEFIGSGEFKVKICDFTYGKNGRTATSYSGIFESMEELQTYYSNGSGLELLSDCYLAKLCYDFGYNNNKRVSAKKKKIIEKIRSHGMDWWGHMDEAFDDSSHIIQLSSNGKVRVIGFKTNKWRRVDKSTIRSCIVQKEEFDKILQMCHAFLLSLRTDLK